MFLRVNKPSTLHLSLKEGCNYFCLKNKKKEIVYERFVGNKKHIKLNMKWAGEYYANQPFKLLLISDLKIEKPRFKLPVPERNRERKVKVVFNPKLKGTPARIYTLLGRIEISPSFKEFNPPTRLFILLHELGHFYYETEWKTDLFALWHYISLGYNNSQAFYSLSRILSENDVNKDRIYRLFKTIYEHEKRGTN